MGCTSSTPNMVPANANPTDKIIHFSEDTKNYRRNDNSANDGNETIEKVLPACDNLDESRQLVRNNKSLLDTSHVQAVKDSYTNGHIIDGDKTLNNKETQVEEKLSSLEDVVDKVVELYISDDNTRKLDIVKNIPESSIELLKNDEQSEIANIEEILDETSEKIPHVEMEASEKIEENLEEAISPSQSTSSRATRWEALADIAAELPPSLAVDPVTGQIYAHSK